MHLYNLYEKNLVREFSIDLELTKFTRRERGLCRILVRDRCAIRSDSGFLNGHRN